MGMGMIPKKIVYWVLDMGIGMIPIPNTHTNKKVWVSYPYTIPNTEFFGYQIQVWVWELCMGIYSNPDFFVCECMFLVYILIMSSWEAIRSFEMPCSCIILFESRNMSLINFFLFYSKSFAYASLPYEFFGYGYGRYGNGNRTKTKDLLYFLSIRKKYAHNFLIQ